MELEKIKGLIKKAELESAKAEGQLERIKETWKEEYGTDDVEVVLAKLEDLKAEKEKISGKIEKLYNELITSKDWEKISEELG